MIRNDRPQVGIVEQDFMLAVFSSPSKSVSSFFVVVWFGPTSLNI